MWVKLLKLKFEYEWITGVQNIQFHGWTLETGSQTGYAARIWLKTGCLAGACSDHLGANDVWRCPLTLTIHTHTHTTSNNRPLSKQHVTVSWSNRCLVLDDETSSALRALCVPPPPPFVFLLDSVERDEVISLHSIPGITHHIVGAYGFYITLMWILMHGEYCCCYMLEGFSQKLSRKLKERLFRNLKIQFKDDISIGNKCKYPIGRFFHFFK